MSKQTVTVTAHSIPRAQQTFLRRCATTVVVGATGAGTGFGVFSAVSRMIAPAAGLAAAGITATAAAPIAAGVAAGLAAMCATQWAVESFSGHDEFVKADDIRPTDSAATQPAATTDAQPAAGASNEAAKTH